MFVNKIASVFDFYIKSSIHISLCVLAFVIITCLRFEIKLDFLILFVVFNATIVVYNFIKYASTLPYYFIVKNVSTKKIQYLSFFSGFLLFTSLFFVSLKTLVLGFFIFIFCIIYVIPFNHSRGNFRNHSKIKIFIVAFCWASATVFLPIINENKINYLNSFLLFFQRFVFVIAYTIPFEIRDLKYDSLQLETIPQLLGIIKTKKAATVLLIVFLIISLVLEPVGFKFLISDSIIVIITAYFVWTSKIRQKKYFASFWVESIPLIWLAILIVMKLFS